MQEGERVGVMILLPEPVKLLHNSTFCFIESTHLYLILKNASLEDVAQHRCDYPPILLNLRMLCVPSVRITINDYVSKLHYTA